MKLKPILITASKEDKGKEADKVDDNKFDTRWSAEGNGEWIEFKFDKEYRITKVELTCYHYDRTYYFRINNKDFKNLKGRKKNKLIPYDLTDLDIESNSIRIIGYGNDTTNYNSFRKIVWYGEEIPDPVIIIKSPEIVNTNSKVILDGGKFTGDILKIEQIGGTPIKLLVAGTFRQSFKAPDLPTVLKFKATGYHGKRSKSVEFDIKVI